jgi:hypothetical protein
MLTDVRQWQQAVRARFQIPASPSTSSAPGLRGTESRKADTTAISLSRPITAA